VSLSDEEKRDLIKKESANFVDNFEGWANDVFAFESMKAGNRGVPASV
jgi:hypothetical protein